MDARDLTLAEARRLFSYDPDTGVLTRIACADISKLGPCTARKNGYVYVRANGAKYLGHRIAWLLHHGRWPVGMLDHKNGCRDDNRIENLRDVDQVINQQNNTKPQRNSTTGIRGVNRDGQLWRAQITVRGKKKNLGRFETAEEAGAAYLGAKKLMHAGYLPA